MRYRLLAAFAVLLTLALVTLVRVAPTSTGSPDLGRTTAPTVPIQRSLDAANEAVVTRATPGVGVPASDAREPRRAGRLIVRSTSAEGGVHPPLTLVLVHEPSGRTGTERAAHVVADDRPLVVDELVPGTYSWTVHDDRGARVEAGTIDIAAGDNEIVVVVPPRAVLECSVTDGRGVPVSGAEMRLIADAFGLSTASELTATANAAGVARFQGLETAALYELQVTSPGHAPWRSDAFFLDEDPEVTRADVVLEETARIDGRVVDPMGEPVGEVRVVLQLPDAEREAVTSSEGTFSFVDLPRTVAAVRTDARVLVNDWQQVELDDDSAAELTLQLTLQLTEGHVLEGIAVLEDGRPYRGGHLQGAPVFAVGALVHGADYEASAKTAEIDEEGRFTMGPFPAGPIRIRELFTPGFSRVVDSRAAPVLVIPELRSREFFVRLLAGGAPVEASGTYAVTSGTVSTGRRRIETGPDGVAIARAMTISSAATRLVIHIPGYASVEIDDLEARLGEGRWLDVSLSSVEPVVVTVTDVGGAPIGGAWVRLAWSRSRGEVLAVSGTRRAFVPRGGETVQHVLDLQTDAGGRVLLPAGPPPESFVVVEDGYAPQTDSLGETDRVEIILVEDGA